ncbi:hypothetical protein HPP92_003218 [Vanilla planifolia]|uniref:Uncharacterized protein n=1 Tax=Vanilla planifolia TaxID=51239 RepID=A0A835S7W5_VANPL|nr:hypothetical protein HPP92_003218 [Vanilla planifolia]
MAARVACRYLVRRFSSGGRVLSEEEKAAENVYIKGLCIFGVFEDDWDDFP